MPTPVGAAAAPDGRGDHLQDVVTSMLREQSKHCRSLRSELYAQLLDAAAEDCAAGGPTWQVLAPVATGDWAAALALRFMAGVHRLVLEGRARELARFFPSVGGTEPPGDAAWVALRNLLVDQGAEVTRLSAEACQTNEVGRCRALVVGFLTVARETGLPLRLLEVGASAGLNLRWDRYFMADSSGSPSWGPSDSPVRLVGPWDVDESLLDTQPRVVSRQGCDPRPIDPLTPDGHLRVLSALWADQLDRFERARGALEVAAAVPAQVDRARAGMWVPERLETGHPGVATVTFHSVVWQYLPAEDQIAMTEAIERAGAAATPDAPVAWLSMEPDNPGRIRYYDVVLRLWPNDGGRARVMAHGGAHGFPLHRPGHTLGG